MLLFEDGDVSVEMWIERRRLFGRMKDLACFWFVSKREILTRTMIISVSERYPVPNSYR